MLAADKLVKGRSAEVWNMGKEHEGFDAQVVKLVFFKGNSGWNIIVKIVR